MEIIFSFLREDTEKINVEKKTICQVALDERVATGHKAQMGFLGGELGYRLLRALWPAPVYNLSGKAYADKDKLQVVLGADVYKELEGKVVVDFGCGEGLESVRIAQNGAARVIGVDSRRNR